MEQRIASFRHQVEVYFGCRPGRGCRYPASLRAEAVDLALEAQSNGDRLGRVAAALGVGVDTLRRWIEAAPPRPIQLRAVEVVEADEVAIMNRSHREGLVLVTVAGHRVEGLALADVALLLEALG